MNKVAEVVEDVNEDVSVDSSEDEFWEELSASPDDVEVQEEGEVTPSEASESQETEGATVEGDTVVAEVEEPAKAEPEISTKEVSAQEAPAQPIQEAPKSSIEEQIIQSIDAAYSELEKSYAFSDEDADKLQTEPEVVLPKLAATMHANIVKTVISQLKHVVPQYIEEHSTAVSQEDQAWNEFYSANEDIKGKATKEQILQVSQVYRTMHPNAKKDEVIKGVGDAIRMTLGIQASPAANSNSTIAQPSEPTATVKPFTPAQGRGHGSVTKPDNIWAELIEADDD